MILSTHLYKQIRHGWNRELRSPIFSIPVSLILCCLCFYFVGDLGLAMVSRKFVDSVPWRARTIGIHTSSIGYQNVSWAPPFQVAWHDLSAQFQRRPSAKGQMEIESLRLSITGFSTVSLSLEGSVFDYEAGSDGEETVTLVLEKTTIFDLHFDPASPASLATSIQQALTSLAENGRVPQAIELSGVLRFRLGESLHEIPCFVQRIENQSVVHLSSRELTALAEDLGLELTAREIDLVSRHPRRAPKLLHLKNRAQSLSEEASRLNRRISRDAYRHVLWSYELTLAYGESFAKAITDAHEEGDTGNTAAERAMDYHNNRLGREYAREGISIEQLRRRVIHAPQVVRTPDRLPPNQNR